MEDSEQRKKRLKEMRMQADLAKASGGVEGSGSGMPGFLSNPLNEASSTMPSQDKSYAGPRFDFYTDPMAAFSSNKRSNANIQVTPDYFPPPNFGGSPMAQFASPHPESMNPQMTSSPTQVSPAPYRNSGWNGSRGPDHYNFPFHPSSGGTYPSPGMDLQMTSSPTQVSPAPYRNSGWNGSRGPAHYNFPFHPSSGGTYPSPGMDPQMTSSPTQVSPAPYRNSGWNGSRGPAHYNFPFHPSSGGTYPSPGFDPSGGLLYNSQGVIHRPSHVPNCSPGYSSSPSPSPGRDRGFWHSTKSPIPGRDSRQVRSTHGRWSNESNEDRTCGPDRFYKRSMVEDPWKLLKPVIWQKTDASWNTLFTPENSKSWTSKSISTKPGESSAASVKTNSQPSLAEYLAAAFNEAANDTEDV